ncbi:hypothetical protein COOONC_12010, partial [Cooperia oncophora]
KLTTSFKASQYAAHLYDAFYIYAVALNRTLAQNPQMAAMKNGSQIMNNAAMYFESISEMVEIGPNGTRYPSFYLDSFER